MYHSMGKTITKFIRIRREADSLSILIAMVVWVYSTRLGHDYTGPKALTDVIAEIKDTN